MRIFIVFIIFSPASFTGTNKVSVSVFDRKWLYSGQNKVIYIWILFLSVANLSAQFFKNYFCSKGQIRFYTCWYERLYHEIDRFLPICCSRNFDGDSCSIFLYFISIKSFKKIFLDILKSYVCMIRKASVNGNLSALVSVWIFIEPPSLDPSIGDSRR